MNTMHREFGKALLRSGCDFAFTPPPMLLFGVVLAVVTNGFKAHFWTGAILTVCWIPMISLLVLCYLLFRMFLLWRSNHLPPFESIPAGIPIGPHKPAPLMAHARLPHRGD